MIFDLKTKKKQDYSIKHSSWDTVKLKHGNTADRIAANIT